MNGNSPIHIFHNNDLYEFYLKGNVVVRTYRFTNTGVKTELAFTDVPEAVVKELLDIILED